MGDKIDTTSLASRLFKVWFEQSALEDEMMDLFGEAGFDVEDFHYDNYDNSLELYTDGYVPTYTSICDELKSLVSSMGFTKLYWHHNAKNGLKGSRDPDCLTFHMAKR